MVGMSGDLNARVGNEVIERIVGQYESACLEEIKVVNGYFRCVQSRSWWLATVCLGRNILVYVYMYTNAHD